MHYYQATENGLNHFEQLPAGAKPFLQAIPRVLPPHIGELHQALYQWQGLGRSPGSIVPERIWIREEQELFMAFAPNTEPKPLMQIGLAREVAAWLVLLDQWMETFVVIARARAIWTPNELVAALTFLTPAFLPEAVIQSHNEWERVAQAVALSVADGPLAGTPTDKHWQG